MFRDNHVIIIYWLKKGQENSLFWTSLDDIILRSFTFPNWIKLVEELIRGKESFEIILIDHYAGDIGNIDIAGKH